MSNLGARGGQIITRAGDGRRAVVAGDRFDRWSGERVRLTRQDRHRIILDAAMRLLASGRLLIELKWETVAAECAVQTSVMTVRRTFDQSVVALRRAAAERGRREGNAGIIAQGIEHGFLTP